MLSCVCYNVAGWEEVFVLTFIGSCSSEFSLFQFPDFKEKVFLKFCCDPRGRWSMERSRRKSVPPKRYREVVEMTARKKGPAKQRQEPEELVPPTPQKSPPTRRFNKGKGKKGGGSGLAGPSSQAQVGRVLEVGPNVGQQTQGVGEAVNWEQVGPMSGPEGLQGGSGPVGSHAGILGQFAALPPAAMAAVLALAQSLSNVMAPVGQAQGPVAVAAAGGVAGGVRPILQDADCAAVSTPSDGGSREISSESSSEGEEDHGRHLGSQITQQRTASRDRSFTGNLGRLPVAGGSSQGPAVPGREHLPRASEVAGPVGVERECGAAGGRWVGHALVCRRAQGRIPAVCRGFLIWW
ncbi:collagen alpha-2(I) chain-like [Bombina bombina]|uniref:collagen alpha-2(I) chain-like n=1 Tax=Bombina bombina TaxID=8345 RepID=UPI00235AA956|nr:collagen alpha-2(I) chain-like [Bombina bombina]XP_053569200.1 collagen alpha-2(I) chain-like [Bombina bombina]